MKLSVTWLKRIYVVAIIAAFLFWRAFWTLDALFLVALSIFVIYGYGKEFIRKFLPFVVLLISYDALRGLVPLIDKHVHFTTMIDFDKWIAFGTIPTIRLQQLLYHGHLAWYDFYFYFLYMIHFVVPFAVAILIWRTRPKLYWRYVMAFVALSYAGFLTYLAFPAAPPWMASELHYIDTIRKLSTDIWWAMGVHNFPSLNAKFNPNPVAAVPSLHCAYPTLVFLFLLRAYGRKMLPFIIYPASIWFGVVYLGEHYVFDVLIGIGYATAAYLGVNYAFDRWAAKKAAQAKDKPQPA